MQLGFRPSKKLAVALINAAALLMLGIIHAVSWEVVVRGLEIIALAYIGAQGVVDSLSGLKGHDIYLEQEDAVSGTTIGFRSSNEEGDKAKK